MARVAGRVFSAGDGAPLAGAVVDLIDPADRLISRNLTDSRGRFLFNVGQGGDFFIGARAPGHRFKRAAVFLYPGTLSTCVDLALVPRESSDWATFQCNSDRSAHSPGSVNPPLVVYWRFLTQGELRVQPVIRGNVVYCCSSDHSLYTFNAESGRLLWRFSTGFRLHAAPAAAGGRLFLPSRDGSLYALDALSGRILWQFNVELLDGASPVAEDNFVCCGGADGRVYALAAETGELVWIYKTGAPIESSPGVAGGYLIISSLDKSVYALEMGSGQIVWRHIAVAPVAFTSLYAGGLVHVCDNAGNLYALDGKEGDPVWTWKHGYPPAAAGGSDGELLYLPAGNNLFACEVENGRPRWTFQAGDSLMSPAVAARVVFVTGRDGYLYGIDKGDGTVVEQLALDPGGPPAMANGMVFVPSLDGAIYALVPGA